MMVAGTDPHKASLTIGVIDEAGREQGTLTVPTDPTGFERVWMWCGSYGSQLVWAVEDCRHVTGAWERFLLARGARVVRVPPRLMAATRRSHRTPGKSDAIDAYAVARAALARPDLPTASVDEAAREIDLLLARRDDLVAERNRIQQRLRWHLHELGLERDVPARCLSSRTWLGRVDTRLAALAPSLLIASAASW